MFEPLNTSGDDTAKRKVLLYGHHGWGKTTQLKYFQEEYGKGFIFSGESGLSSIRSAGIDYLPFSSWDNPSDPKKGIYSFKDGARLKKELQHLIDNNVLLSGEYQLPDALRNMTKSLSLIHI